MVKISLAKGPDKKSTILQIKSGDMQWNVSIPDDATPATAAQTLYALSMIMDPNHINVPRN